MTAAAPLMFKASTAHSGGASASAGTRQAAEPDTAFARVAADLASPPPTAGAAQPGQSSQSGQSAGTPAAVSQPTGGLPAGAPPFADPDAAMKPMPPVAGTPPGAPATTRHATPIAHRMDPRLAIADAATAPVLTPVAADAVAPSPLLPRSADAQALSVSPDDALSQQMYALLSGLAPPAAPADAPAAIDAVDLLAGTRATPMPPAQTLPLAPAATDAAATPGTGAIELSSLLAELPAMPRPAETAAAAPVAAAAASGALAEVKVEVEREDAGAIDGLDALLPGAPLAPQSAIRATGATTASPPPLQMPTHPQAGFDDELGARVAWAAEQKLGHAEIRLNPEHLGRIDLKIQLDGTHVSAEFNSANADVRQALEATLPRLREMLGQHGLQLGQADVGQRQQDARQSQGQTASAFGGTGSGDEGASANIASSSTAPALRNRGLLDEYA